VQFGEIEIGAQKPRNDDHPGTVAGRNAKAVVDRGGMQQENFGAEEGFRPEGAFGLQISIGRLPRRLTFW
jgi:hypothetical protein